ncbi:hypothetical protein [Halomonas sp. NO4]|uniref:hypothetical protein n=1 Tax=Halomonas sp. NO4 TaxID=2484813 RepID=UPI0013D806EA|nr:hypothetical protein [Halomonas sp. NO4]
MNYVIYGSDLPSPIHRIVTLPKGSDKEAEGNCLDGERFIAVDVSSFDDTTHYVDLSGDEPVVKERESLDTTHTIAGLEVTFQALPSGTEIEVNRQTMIADGDDVIEFDLPGTYSISLAGPPAYRDEELEVTVDA